MKYGFYPIYSALKIVLETTQETSLRISSSIFLRLSIIHCASFFMLWKVKTNPANNYLF